MPQDPAKPPGALGKPDKPTSPTAEKPDHTDGTTPTQPGTDRVDTAAPVPKKDSNDTKPHIGSDPVKDASETKPTTAADPKKGAGETKPENDVKTNGGKDISVPAIDPKKPGAEVKPSTTPFSVLRARPFILKTVKHETADATPRVTGSILSQSLDKMLATGGPVQAETLTMAALRKLVPEMSRYPSIDKFCTPSGTLIDDEAISIIDYLALEAPEEAPSTGGTPVLKLHFRPTKMGELAGKGANGTEAGAVTAPDLTKAPAVTAPTGPVATLLPKREAANPLLDAAQYGGIQVQTSDGAGKLSETQWSVVLRNCAVFYGWIIDPRTKRAIRAPKPAFKLRSKVNQQAVASIPDFVVNTSREAGPLNEANSKSSDAQSIESKSVKAVTPKSEEGIPNFRVNDDSRIEITAHSDELSVSMAKSDFSSESTEVSVSGGGYGVSVGVSAGYAKSSEKSLQENSNSKSQTIVGRYMFPRCDLLMWPNELEPTDELAELLETVRRTKNIKVLRRLQAEYGNLFCQRVTLGGRLMTTKTVQIDEKTTVEAEKSSFKLALGASVSGSYAGISASASVKHEKSEGGSKTEETSTRSQHEACVFEAVGGETILATDPKAWSPTVANHELWRIINVCSIPFQQCLGITTAWLLINLPQREALSSLVEILSQMPEYDAVQSWFVQAVPALNQYMTLDAGHQCKARLRVTAPGNSLMITNNGSDASFYLGHDPSNAVTPRLSSVDTAEGKFWERHGVMLSEPIFHPTTYRAPAIFGYNISSVGDAPYGSKYNKEYAMTTWDIIAPFDEEVSSCHLAYILY